MSSKLKTLGLATLIIGATSILGADFSTIGTEQRERLKKTCAKKDGAAKKTLCNLRHFYEPEVIHTRKGVIGAMGGGLAGLIAFGVAAHADKKDDKKSKQKKKRGSWERSNKI